MHRIKRKLEPSAADTEPITNLRREGKALQIETIDSEFTESESLFDYEKSKSTASSTLNYFSWVIGGVKCLGDAPNSDLPFNVIKLHNISGKPKPSEDYLLEENSSRFEYRFGYIILADTHITILQLYPEFVICILLHNMNCKLWLQSSFLLFKGLLA